MIICFSTAPIGAFRSLRFHSVICSLGGPLSHGSPFVLFFDHGHPLFWNFYSTIPVDVVRVKSYMNCLLDFARVVMRVTIYKLYFVPEWLVTGVVSMLWNGRGLGTGESDVSIVLILSCIGLPVSPMYTLPLVGDYAKISVSTTKRRCFFYYHFHE